MTTLLSGFTLHDFLDKAIGAEREAAQRFYGPSLFGDIAALLAGARGQPGKTVILLPAILVTSLVDGADDKLVWLELAGLTLGNGMKRLRAGDDAAADGGAGTMLAREPLVAFYGSMYAYFSDICGFNTIPFGFDWRLSIGRAVEAFDRLINTIAAPKFTIVAHSMGALVTRRWVELHPQSADRIEQAIFLGPPFSGSFAPLEALSGKAWFSSLVGTLIGADTLAATFGTFPGFAEHIPDPSANHFPGSWAHFDAPEGPLAKFRAELLGRARAFSDAFRRPTGADAAADDALMRRSSIVLGTSLRTAVSADLVGPALRFRSAPFGDNTVPLTSAWDDRATMYETRVDPDRTWMVRRGPLVDDGARHSRNQAPAVRCGRDRVDLADRSCAPNAGDLPDAGESPLPDWIRERRRQRNAGALRQRYLAARLVDLSTARG